MKNKFYLLISEDDHVLNMREVAAAKANDNTLKISIEFLFDDGETSTLHYLDPITRDNMLHMINEVIEVQRAAESLNVDILSLVERSNEFGAPTYLDVNGNLVSVGFDNFYEVERHMETLQKYKNNIRRHFY